MPPLAETEQQVIPWNDAVRSSGRVKVFVAPGMSRGGWAGMADKGIRALNDQLRAKGIKVVIEKVDREEDANAVLDTTPSIELHGQSLLDTHGTRFIQKVAIKVPATPKISKTEPDAREVGPDVRLYIVVHELIHTLGLTNAAHSRDDVFTRGPTLLPDGMVLQGRRITEDKVRSFNLTVIPPIVLGASTITNLKRAWPD